MLIDSGLICENCGKIFHSVKTDCRNDAKVLGWHTTELFDVVHDFCSRECCNKWLSINLT